MKTHYEVEVNYTAKPVGMKYANWRSFDKEIKKFKTFAEAKQYIRDNYKGKSKVKIYIDDENKKPKHIGYIYKMGIVEYTPGDKIYEQHWVSINEIKSTPVLIN